MSTWHQKHEDGLSLGDKASDWLSGGMGSWRFIIGQTAIIVAWIVILGATVAWDPYPYQLLTLALSLQAAYAAPIIMMSQNRQSERDRVHAQHDYANNEESLELLRKHGEILARLDPEKGEP